MSPAALIADIRRLTLHDGPGTRDTVFVKGCPLHCIWCHNPESISPRPRLLFRANLCHFCGECPSACPQRVHSLQNGLHLLERSRCVACGACVNACLPGALSLCGKTMTAQEVFQSVLAEKDFFLQSHGGVTVSGGEPLLYPDFTAALFQLLKQERIPTALDTCGAVPFAAFESVLPFTDRILFDIKGFDPVRHQQNTGQGNHRILENLLRLQDQNTPVEIRMPIVPGRNDDLDEIRAIAHFLNPLPEVRLVRLLPYHSLAREKYLACGRPDTMPDAPAPSPGELARIAGILHNISGKDVRF